MSKRTISPSMAVSLTALVFSMTGAGLAANTALRGPQGKRGPRGAQGAQGNQGPKGDGGPTGPTGLKGDTTVIQAKEGAKGATGEQGYKGATGPQGPNLLERECGVQLKPSAGEPFPYFSAGAVIQYEGQLWLSVAGANNTIPGTPNSAWEPASNVPVHEPIRGSHGSPGCSFN